MTQDRLTDKQSDYAVFLPAISGFYATFIGKQRNEEYVDPARFPQGLTDMEQMNWLDDAKSLFPYKWSLYSGGHANLDLNKQDWSEDMVRNREAGTLMLGDSGGFQIAKGLWEGDWKANSGCAKAQAKREAVLDQRIARNQVHGGIPLELRHPRALQVEVAVECAAGLQARAQLRRPVLLPVLVSVHGVVNRIVN